MKERLQREINELESWIDETHNRFSAFLSERGQHGRRRSSVILSDECKEQIKRITCEYEEKGFKKKRIQDGIEFADAMNPFDNSKFGTLREKHNTFMNFILMLEAKQKMKEKQQELQLQKIEKEHKLLIEAAEKEREEENARKEYQRKELERMERERLEAERRHAGWRQGSMQKNDATAVKLNLIERDMSGIPLELSSDKQNELCNGRFIGSIYVNSDSENWSERFSKDKSSSWRVRL